MYLNLCIWEAEKYLLWHTEAKKITFNSTPLSMMPKKRNVSAILPKSKRMARGMEFNGTNVCDVGNNSKVNGNHSVNIWIFGISMCGASNLSHSLLKNMIVVFHGFKSSSMQSF